jgi:hypothetical protein
MAESRGMLVFRSSDTSLYIRSVLFDGADVKIVAGATSLRIWHVIPTTGALETYDFNDNLFKVGAITTATVAMTHRQAENATYDTGLWTYRHTSLGDFEVGDKYVFEIRHADLPRPVTVEYQYGDTEGDTVALVADEVWDENVVAAHGAASSAGLLLRTVGAEISTRAFNNTLNDLLGVPDTAATDTVPGQTWEELAAAHNTLLTMGEIMNNIVAAGFPSVADITDGVWNANNALHLLAGSTGLHLSVLGSDIATRANFPSLNSLLGVPDTAGHDIADTIFNTDMTHWTVADVDQAGWLLRVLGLTMSRRTNTPDLNDLLDVPDTAGLNIANPIHSEVVDAVGYNIPNSAGRRLWSLDDLTEAGGAGDLAYVHGQVEKIDQLACDSPAVAGSLADKMDDLAIVLALADRNIITSCNIQGNNLRIEVAVEQYGVVQTVPWDQCVAQIFDEAGAIVANIGAADFGAIGLRGFFTYSLSPHPLTSGATYQIQVAVTDTGPAVTLQTTKLLKVVTV